MSTITGSLQGLAQPKAHDRVVVDEQDAQGVGGRSRVWHYTVL